MSNFFERMEKELRKESFECLPKLQEIIKDSCKYFAQMDLIDKPVLIELLEMAIEKIASFENENYYDEDAMDCLCDKEFIFEDLVKLCIDFNKLFID